MSSQKFCYCSTEAEKNLRRNLTETISSSISVAIALLIIGILFLYFTIIDDNSVSGLGLSEVPNYIKFKVISKVIGCVSAILTPIIALVIVISEMRVIVNSKKEEIKLMKLIGAEDSFVYLIYVMEGLVIGIIGAVLAIVLLFLISKGIIILRVTFFKELTLVIPNPYLVVIQNSLNFLMFGIFIGIAGSIIALRKTLKQIN